jgi:hypothetical protein
MISSRKSFGHQEEMVKEAIGSAIIVEAMIIYHMIAPMRTMCGSRTGGCSLLCVMSD